jgi:hypothetical protein
MLSVEDQLASFCYGGFLVLTQRYACDSSNVYSCVITLWYDPFVFGCFLKGFLFEPGDCMATNFPLLYFFSPPELISASRTGLSVNNILPFQKKNQLFSMKSMLKGSVLFFFQ